MPAFFTDECFSGNIIRALQAASFDIVRAIDICPSEPDETVLAIAYAQDRILLTEDYDFGELCVRLGLPAHGVVIVALKGMSATNQGARVVKCLTDLSDRLIGSFVTVEPTRVRMRPLPLPHAP